VYWNNPYSKFHKQDSLEAILRKNLRNLAKRPPGFIDPEIYDVVVAINQLPFVVETIESCSGHYSYKTRLPPVVESAVKNYFNNIHVMFAGSNAKNRKRWRKLLQPHYCLAAFFLSRGFIERLWERRPCLYQDTFIKYAQKNLPHYEDIADQIMDYELGMKEVIDMPIFKKLAQFSLTLHPPFISELENLAEVLIEEKQGYGDLDSFSTSPFLQILYLDVPQARIFHKKLSQIFEDTLDFCEIDEVIHYPKLCEDQMFYGYWFNRDETRKLSKRRLDTFWRKVGGLVERSHQS